MRWILLIAIVAALLVLSRRTESFDDNSKDKKDKKDKKDDNKKDGDKKDGDKKDGDKAKGEKGSPLNRAQDNIMNVQRDLDGLTKTLNDVRLYLTAFRNNTDRPGTGMTMAGVPKPPKNEPKPPKAEPKPPKAEPKPLTVAVKV